MTTRSEQITGRSEVRLMSRMSDFNGCRVPDPPEYGECYGYWEDPDHFDLINCKGCEMYEECCKEWEEDEEGL